MALRARKVSGAFEKRVPVPVFGSKIFFHRILHTKTNHEQPKGEKKRLMIQKIAQRGPLYPHPHSSKNHGPPLIFFRRINHRYFNRPFTEIYAGVEATHLLFRVCANLVTNCLKNDELTPLSTFSVNPKDDLE